MSAVEAFLAKWELFRCERLLAVITKKQCAVNRKDGRVFACSGCPGLGASASLSSGGEDMSNVLCKVAGCEKRAQSKGMCKAHLNGTTPRRSGGSVAVPRKNPPFTVAPVPAPALPAVEVIDESDWKQQTMVVSDDFGMVQNSEGDQSTFGTDLVVVLALREAWQAKEAEWLADLSGLKPGQTIMRAQQMIMAVEALGV